MTNRAALRHSRWPGVALLLLAAFTAPAGDAAPLEIEDEEVYEHLIEPLPVVATPWEDGSRDLDLLTWIFDVTVDEYGKVSAAQLKSGPREFREDAIRAAREFRFKPFLQDGRAVAVRFELPVRSQPADYAGPADREFPAKPDLSTVVIALRRTACLGTCPDYRLELRGNGEVTYRGNNYVLVKGAHRWRVDAATIAPLLELFRRANYFALKGYYEYPVTDLPTYVTRLSIDGRHKFVSDYGGEMGGEQEEDDPGPEMPPVVAEIEDAIDAVAKTASWVTGDEDTMRRLREARWNFHSNDAGNALRMLLSNCNTKLAREFIRAGAPMNVPGKRMFDSGLAISNAAHCADIDLVRMMMSKGALERSSDAEAFLWSSVTSGQPDMVAVALTKFGDVNAKNENGGSLLVQAAKTFANDGDPGEATFDAVKVIEMLIDAGADPNARDADGKTPIFEANDKAVTAVLIKRGADPSARDKKGQTALFGRYFSETKLALLAAGVDVNARDNNGSTPLFYQHDLGSIKILLGAGADVNAVDLKGQTVIESIYSEDGFADLLAAGARLPADPERLKALIAKAAKNRWSSVLPQLEAAAAKK